MLREITRIRQSPGEPTKRWFTDEAMDLYVWFDESDSIVGFQLAYDKPHAERALTWKRDRGFDHAAVDDGTRPGRHPGTPLLVADGSVDVEWVVEAFRANAGEVDAHIRTFVESKIRGCAAQRAGEPGASRSWLPACGLWRAGILAVGVVLAAAYLVSLLLS